MTDTQHPDDGDITRRQDIPSDPAQAPAWPATPTNGDPAPPVDRYSPPPEPRNDWTRHDGEPEAAPTPERWYEPAVPAVVTAPVTSDGGPRPARRSSATTVLAAAILSAVLASGGTVLALRATGGLDRPAVTQTGPTGTTVGATTQPVTVDENSATIDVAAAVSPAVVRIKTSANVDT
ncbi:MAG TPA: hypothetical protein VM408_09635, partial [Methylomirabilota bacterium]|nr:hypothetical protein [Methylomirabilota bacterium]